MGSPRTQDSVDFILFLVYVSLALGGRTYQAKAAAVVFLIVCGAAFGWSLSCPPVVAAYSWVLLLLVMAASLAGKGAQAMDVVDRRFRRTPAPAGTHPWV